MQVNDLGVMLMLAGKRLGAAFMGVFHGDAPATDAQLVAFAEVAEEAAMVARRFVRERGKAAAVGDA